MHIFHTLNNSQCELRELMLLIIGRWFNAGRRYLREGFDSSQTEELPLVVGVTHHDPQTHQDLQDALRTCPLHPLPEGQGQVG